MSEEPGTFEIYGWSSGPGGSDEFSWELVTADGVVRASARDLVSREAAETSIRWIREHVAECPVRYHPPEGDEGRSGARPGAGDLRTP